MYTKDGVVCTNCLQFNTHEQAGTYDVWNPCCVYCGHPTEGDIVDAER